MMGEICRFIWAVSREENVFNDESTDKKPLSVGRQSSEINRQNYTQRSK